MEIAGLLKKRKNYDDTNFEIAGELILVQSIGGAYDTLGI